MWLDTWKLTLILLVSFSSHIHTFHWLLKISCTTTFLYFHSHHPNPSHHWLKPGLERNSPKESFYVSLIHFLFSICFSLIHCTARIIHIIMFLITFQWLPIGHWIEFIVLNMVCGVDFGMTLISNACISSLILGWTPHPPPFSIHSVTPWHFIYSLTSAWITA